MLICKIKGHFYSQVKITEKDVYMFICKRCGETIELEKEVKSDVK